LLIRSFGCTIDDQPSGTRSPCQIFLTQSHQLPTALLPRLLTSSEDCAGGRVADRFGVWPRWLSHLRVVSMGWERQGPTWIAIKRPKTIHLVQRLLHANSSTAGGERSPMSDPRDMTSPSTLTGPGVQLTGRLWSNFLNAIRSPSGPGGRPRRAHDWTRCSRSGIALRKSDSCLSPFAHPSPSV
jgi:hypothetical protein